MQTKESILEYLRSHKEEFKERYGVEEIALFGSYARGEATERSDVDLLVSMPSKWRLFYNLKTQIENDLSLPIDMGYFHTLRAFIRSQIANEMIYV